jgi:mannose-1-phosphate guanylyltransferase
MRALVLCAGLGTRLRPLTERWPKPALPLLGAPLLRYALATLGRAGLREVAINTHHLPGVMTATARAEAARAGVTLVVGEEPGAIQGTGGGIRGARAFLEGGDFVVLAGDLLFALELGPVLEAHRRRGAAATMALLPMPAGATYNAVEADPSGRVRRIAGHGPGGPALARWHFTGVHVITPRVFDFFPPDGPCDINHHVYPRMIEAGLEVHGHLLADEGAFWSDLGSPTSYALAHQALLRGQVPTSRFGPADPFLGMLEPRPGVWVHPGASYGDTRATGPAWVGEGAVLEEGVHLGAAVSVGPGARVGAGARLDRVAVLDGAVVPAGARLEDALVAPGGVVVPTG